MQNITTRHDAPLRIVENEKAARPPAYNLGAAIRVRSR
ncbi:hypothetical protein DA2_3933 [Desulfovibrio sp. A2]|nr:hypothetical protein DA2_3933 [Desulfovibrio sp. A2]